MPMFDYTCSDCGKHFEKIVKQADQEVECPACGSHQTERALGIPSVGSATATAMPMAAACGQGPPCGAPWCQRQG